jgi:D-3-phosphoglycerate dehydrogenase
MAAASRYRFLLFEPMHEAGTRLLASRGEVILAPAPDEAALRPLIGDVDAVVIRAVGSLGRSLLEAAPRLKVIGRHGVGLDTIDREVTASMLSVTPSCSPPPGLERGGQVRRRHP